MTTMNRAEALYNLMRLGAWWVIRKHKNLPPHLVGERAAEYGLYDGEGHLEQTVVRAAESLVGDRGEQTPITAQALRELLLQGGVLVDWTSEVTQIDADWIGLELRPREVGDHEAVYITTTTEGPVVEHSVSSRAGFARVLRPGVKTIEQLTVFLDSIIEASGLRP